MWSIPLDQLCDQTLLFHAHIEGLVYESAAYLIPLRSHETITNHAPHSLHCLNLYIDARVVQARHEQLGELVCGNWISHAIDEEGRADGQ
jgi:hypothetical protein